MLRRSARLIPSNKHIPVARKNSSVSTVKAKQNAAQKKVVVRTSTLADATSSVENVVLQKLLALKAPQSAILGKKRFFKESYCPQDVFLGLAVPTLRSTVKEHLASITIQEIEELIRDVHHEARLAGFLFLTEIYNAPLKATSFFSDFNMTKDVKVCRNHVREVLLKEVAYCNNWDLVDCCAHKVVGEYLVKYHLQDIVNFESLAGWNKKLQALPSWYANLLQSNDLWQVRISIVCLLNILKTRVQFSYSICQYQLERFHATPDVRLEIDNVPYESLDLIHKAIGWVLRENGKQDKKLLKNFLSEICEISSKTTVRYATEHLNRSEAQSYVNRAKKI